MTMFAGPLHANAPATHLCAAEPHLAEEAGASGLPYLTLTSLPTLQGSSDSRVLTRVCIGQVRELRKRTDCLPDDYWVVLTGDLITEEALPTYMAMLNTLDGVRDETVGLQTGN